MVFQVLKLQVCTKHYMRKEGALDSEGGRGRLHSLPEADGNTTNRSMQKSPGRELTRGRECLDGEKKLELLPAGNLLDMTKSV